MSLAKKKRRERSILELQQIAKPYDFKKTNRFTKESINLFESVYGNYARILSNSLFVAFKVPMKVRLEKVFQTAYLDYVMSLPTDAVTAVYTMHPVKGPFCLTFDSQFSFLAYDAILGGAFTNHSPIREFTDVEKFILNGMITNSFIEPQAQCWTEYGSVSPAIREISFNPVLMQLCHEEESLLVLEFTIEANGMDFPLKMAIPYASIENMAEVLQLVRHRDDSLGIPTKESVAHLDKQIRLAPVDCKVLLGKTKLSLSQTNHLKVGEVIKLDQKLNQFLDVFVVDQIHFKAQPATIKDKYAVQIVQVLEKQN